MYVYVCADTQFSFIPYLWICYLLKFISNPKNDAYGTQWLVRHVQSSANWSRPAHIFPAKVEQGDTLPSYLAFIFIYRCPFRGLLSCYMLLPFCLFLWHFYCLKQPPSVVLKCCQCSEVQKSWDLLCKEYTWVRCTSFRHELYYYLLYMQC